MTHKIVRLSVAWLAAGLSSVSFAASLAVNFSPSNQVGDAAAVTATVTYAGAAALGNGTQIVVCYDNTKLTFGTATAANPPGEAQPTQEQAATALCALPANRQILISFVSLFTTWPSTTQGGGTLAPSGNIATITFTTANPFMGSTNVVAFENTAAGGNYGFGSVTSTLSRTITGSTANFSIGNVTVTEGGGTANAVVTCNGAFASNTVTPVNVAFTVGNGAGNFTTPASPVAFTACGGQTRNIVVTPRIEDQAVQGTVTGSITLGAVTTDTGSTVSTTASVVTVNDNDALPSVAVTASGGCAEALVPTNCTFTVIATSNTNPVQSTGSGPSVAFTIAGTASNNTDYKLVSGASCAGAAFTGPIATTFGTPSVMTVCVIDDNIPESGGETVILNLAANAAAYVLTSGSATNTISDDDSPPAISIASSPATVVENAGTATYTLTRSGNAGQLAAPLAVNVVMSGTASFGTACSAGVDYTLGAPFAAGVVTFAATSTTAAVVLTPCNDSIAEPTETAIMTVSTNAAYTVTPPGAATITITDDDVTVSVAPVSIFEGGAAGGFSISCVGPAGSSVSVPYTTAGIGATQGVDYSAPTPASPITVVCNGAATTNVSVSAINNSIVNNARSVRITLGAITVVAPVGGGVTGGGATADAAIIDDDVPTTIPTMNAAGLGLMSLMLIGLAAFQRRRRQL